MHDRLKAEALRYIECMRGYGYSDEYIDAAYLSQTRRLNASEFAALLQETANAGA